MSRENRTEAPTIRRIEKARSEGKFPNGRVLAVSLLFFTSLLLTELIGASLPVRFAEWGNRLRTEPLKLEVTTDSVLQVYSEIPRGFLPFLPLMGGLLLTAVLIPVLTAFFNRGFAFLPGKLAPDMTRLTPRFGAFFSLDTLWRLFLAGLQIFGTLFILGRHLRGIDRKTESLLILPPEDWGKLFREGGLSITVQLAILFLFLGTADLFYQRWKYRYDLRMTKEEVKREMKEEGQG